MDADVPHRGKFPCGERCNSVFFFLLSAETNLSEFEENFKRNSVAAELMLGKLILIGSF